MVLKVLNHENTDFVKDGAKSKEELLSNDKVLIYKSSSLISSMSYAGTAAKITKSSSIPEDFTAILKDIKGYVSLGTTKVYNIYSDKRVAQGVEYKNAHVYSSKATTLDGSERICYIFVREKDKESGTIMVSECSNNKGASYSSLYMILSDKLLSNGFIKNSLEDSFTISLADAPKLVEVINEVIEERVAEEYVLVKEEGRVDTINFGQEKRYYNVAYWHEKSSIQAKDCIDNQEHTSEEIINTLNRLMPRIEAINSVPDIEAIIKKLNSMVRLGNAKKSIIEIKEEV